MMPQKSAAMTSGILTLWLIRRIEYANPKGCVWMQKANRRGHALPAQHPQRPQGTGDSNAALAALRFILHGSIPAAFL
jgi:pyridoxal/pyridoxine/pyridoxamine kinase